MTRRALFREADLARALRVTRAAGLDVNRVRIDADGAIVIESHSAPSGAGKVDEVQAALDELDRRNAERRAARAAPRQH